MDRLEEIKERCAKATEGPWEAHEVGKRYATVCRPTSENTCSGVADVGMDYDMEMSVVNGNDAVFIAHSRSDIPWLIAEAERARKDKEKAWKDGFSAGLKKAEDAVELGRSLARQRGEGSK